LQSADAQHPFKYDHTVYLTEAFRLMDSMQNYLLLDVRSPGSTPLLIYGSGSDFGTIVCVELKKGYKNVNFLLQGLYPFVWSTENVEDCQAGR